MNQVLGCPSIPREARASLQEVREAGRLCRRLPALCEERGAATSISMVAPPGILGLPGEDLMPLSPNARFDGTWDAAGGVSGRRRLD
jgi:hypothetical protein